MSVKATMCADCFERGQKTRASHEVKTPSGAYRPVCAMHADLVSRSFEYPVRDMSTETDEPTDDGDALERVAELVLRVPTFEISALAALAIFGLVMYVTAHMGMTPEQYASLRQYAVVVGEVAVRPPYWRMQANVGQLVFMFAAFGVAAHHLAESISKKEEN